MALGGLASKPPQSHGIGLLGGFHGGLDLGVYPQHLIPIYQKANPRSVSIAKCVHRRVSVMG